ncbi:MAG: T9SS type A sorting domain-containing protein [Candidatus Kapabacteria bacterium]|nr:T9SS type A sorting domain-containing protein [Candidatus Kapabacteria bacterium]
MIRYISLLAVFGCMSMQGFAQRTYDVFSRTHAQKKSDVAQSVALTANVKTVQSIVRNGDGQIEFVVPMPDGASRSLSLTRWSIANAASRLTVMTDNGPRHTSLGEDLEWYRSTSSNGEMAVFTFHASGEMSGMIDGPAGRFLIGRQFREQARNAYVVMCDNDAPYTCATPAEKMSRELDRLISEAHHTLKLEEGVQLADTITMEIAVEADHDLYTSLQTLEATQTYVAQLLAAMSNVYERELSVRFVVTNLRIWETASDPYDDNSDVFGLLSSFVDEYRTNMTSIQRDLAIFLTSRGGQGGIARTIGGICQEDGSYCAGDVLRQIANYPTWSWDVGMMCHEVGHVCGGIHTQSCFWPGGPLDSCVSSESGTCVSFDQVGPTRGTIMSYCHQQIANGATMTLEFHPMHRSVMKSYVRSAACLGNAPPQFSNTLRGKVVDAITQQPIEGVQLLVRAVVNSLYRQTPRLSGDSTATSAADGSYMFTSLSKGLYEIIVKPPYVPYPIATLSQSVTNGVIIADSVTIYDVPVVKGQTIKLIIDNDGDTTPVSVNIYSDQLPDLVERISLPFIEPGDTAIVFERAFPIGRYIVVPTSNGRQITPNKNSVELVVSEDPKVIRCVSTSTFPSVTSTIALGVGNRERYDSPTRLHLAGGMRYRAIENQSNALVQEGVVPDDGVVVIDNVLADRFYEIAPDIDTIQKAPFAENTFVYPMYLYTGALYIQQPRRMPLLAREYSMSALVTNYATLENCTVLRDKANYTSRTATVALPFALNIHGRILTSMYVAKNGFITFGGRPFDPSETYPTTRFSEATLVVAPFATELYPDTTAPIPWRLAWSIEGAEPNRIIKVEWRNYNARVHNWYAGTSSDVGRFSFQIYLHENGTIEMVYDRPVPFTERVAALVGLRGNDILDNQVLISLAENDLLNVRETYVKGGFSMISMQNESAMKKGLTYRWEIAPTGVDDVESVKTGINPTPSTSEFVLSGYDGGTIRVRIVDVLGAVVLTQELPAGERTVDVRTLSSGRYSVVVTTDSRQTAHPLLIHR